jgi:hypothetical protein
LSLSIEIQDLIKTLFTNIRKDFLLNFLNTSPQTSHLLAVNLALLPQSLTKPNDWFRLLSLILHLITKVKYFSQNYEGVQIIIQIFSQIQITNKLNVSNLLFVFLSLCFFNYEEINQQTKLNIDTDMEDFNMNVLINEKISFLQNIWENPTICLFLVGLMLAIASKNGKKLKEMLHFIIFTNIDKLSLISLCKNITSFFFSQQMSK